jgi:hypothetical protein
MTALCLLTRQRSILPKYWLPEIRWSKIFTSMMMMDNVHAVGVALVCESIHLDSMNFYYVIFKNQCDTEKYFFPQFKTFRKNRGNGTAT